MLWYVYQTSLPLKVTANVNIAHCNFEFLFLFEILYVTNLKIYLYIEVFFRFCSTHRGISFDDSSCRGDPDMKRCRIRVDGGGGASRGFKVNQVNYFRCFCRRIMV